MSETPSANEAPMKLVIHVGYPKTATTTLQTNALYPLHQEGRLNFFGNADFIPDKQMQRQDWFIRHLLLLKRSGPGDIHAQLARSPGYMRGFLEPGKLNLFSQEILCFPTATDYLMKELPGRVRAAFGEGIDYKIIFTLRQQASLIGSIFAHGYDIRNYENPDLDTIEKFCDAALTDSYDLGATVDYLGQIDRWAEVFGKENIRICFYEDFISQKQPFFDTWAEVLGIDGTEIRTLSFSKQGHRVRKRGKGANYEALVSWDTIARKKLGKRVAAKLAEGTGLPGRFLFSVLRKLPKKRFVLDGMNTQTRDKIDTAADRVNREVQANYGLNRNSMIEYGYIRPDE